ncbi:MAG: lamin tail domain-containing protein [Phycisphaerae bacterium]|nr:lamin tail domain-containing protein [Phycisphaerae bacterium]
MRVSANVCLSLLLSSLIPCVALAGGGNGVVAWSVVLNEVMAKNEGAVSDAQGDYDDWIEFYNRGSEAIDVAGCWLSDDPSNPAKWRIPASDPLATTIPGHGWLLIWADEQVGDGPLHADFKLAAGGESVALYDPEGVLLDEVVFGEQAPNESYARFPDGDGLWRVCVAPTPGRTNGADPGGVVISEIMYHPYHPPLTPENTAQEWVELLNRGAEPVVLADWRFADAVDFALPDMVLGAGEHLVVAADVDAFRVLYPDVTNVVGGWTGWLSNSGERLTLANAAGVVVNSIQYADEGDWAARELGPEDRGHRGWQWSDEIDGGGKSLELVDAGLPNEFGQNWAGSLENGGTPGRANSVAANGSSPIIADVRHDPSIPKPDDSVTVTARVIDGSAPRAAVRLRYRQDRSSYTTTDSYPHASPDDFTVVEMFDDGAHGDSRAGDGVYGTQIPPHADGVVVEFYVEAFSEGGGSRTWPAPSFVDGQWEQVTNALYRVDSVLDADDYWQIGGKPLYYVVMTEMERGHLARIGSRSNGEEDTGAAMNCTFISIDGMGTTFCHRAAVRNRGHGTRTGPPNNFHVSFPRDGLWKDRSAINFNCRYTHVQILGSAIFRLAGIAAADAVPAELRINGADLASSGSPMYGVYARLDAFDDDFAKKHFRDDPNGNLYTCFRLDSGAAEAELRYEGSDPNVYRNRYFKANHVAQDDWSDLIHMVDVLNNAPEATYLEEVEEVIHLRQWLRYIAVDSLLLNYETGLNMGMGDDYYLYRGVEDRRFMLIPHDLDTILDQGNAHGSMDLTVLSIVEGAPGRNGVDGLKRLFSHPEIVALYCGELADLIDTVFSPERFDPLVDHVLGGWMPEQVLNNIKRFAVNRSAAVLAQIGPQDDANDLNVGGGDSSVTTVASGPLVINEVLANNESAVARDGVFPDLVELYNGGSQAISLSGVSLSDDPQELARFVFPSGTILNPGEYLVLTADNSIAASASDLGFGLDAEGDGLYLYDATGELIDSVEFGSQAPDLSIGRIGPDGAWQLTVPTPGRANVPQPLGDPAAIRINEWLASERVLFESDFIELYNPDPLPVAIGEFCLTDLSSVDPCPYRLRPLSFIGAQGYVVCVADDETDPGHLGFKLSSDGDLIALYDASYTPVDAVVFFPQTPDVSQGRLPDGTWQFEYSVLPTPGLPNLALPEDMVTRFDVVPEDGAKRAIVPTAADQVADDWKSRLDFDDSAWLSVPGFPGGVGYERGTGYEDLIGLDVEEIMYGQYTTCYVRIPFVVDGDRLEALNGLYLSVRYDDGFVAYLNGEEVARANASETLQWDSQATASHEASGTGFDGIYDLSDRVDLLHAGGNLLAIQAMNNSTTSSDFLITALLEGESTATAGDEYPFLDALALLDGLRVTELMYNAPQGEAMDYVELQNVRTEPLDLTGVRFTSGIDFSFPSMSLAPGECTVVAADLTAFRSHYGAAIPVAGEYSGRLSDGGEELVLKLAPPFDAAILRIHYAGTWYPSTDGHGESLTIRAPGAKPATWNDPANWQASQPSPGEP